MTCEQYESLLAESENECQACGTPAAKTSLGMLVIDHDYAYGDWAVRGLICSACNSLFLRDSDGPYWAQPYLTNPWFLREVTRLGLSADLPAEPSHDTCLRDFDGHIWFVEDGVWRWAFKRSLRLTWRELFYRFGPMALTPVDRSELVGSRAYKSYLRVREWRRQRQSSPSI